MKQCFYLLIFILIAGSAQTLSAQSKTKMNRKATKQVNNQSKYGCLPPDIKLDTIVSATPIETAAGNKIERETVRQRLDKIKAGCRAGKLVDGKGREIRFYRLQGCWGNPPPGYQEILENQQKELDELKKKYAVVEITCNPSGGMPF
ncbi:MAG TPA: hypothetical protein VF604_00770 [Pyrinomonadaceae bacterium]|jgi:hypothetical protein